MNLGIVIWAQSVCRSTMALYREVKKCRSDVHVTVVLMMNERGENVRLNREIQGQSDYSDVVDIVWDGELESGRKLLATKGIHVFSGYQVSAVVRRLMREAKELGCRVIGYDEAPCEMCLGVKGVLKRLYYRYLLPHKVRNAVNAADIFISASGRFGIDRLLRLGWMREKIVPFGYMSPRLETRNPNRNTHTIHEKGYLRVLHLGSEASYRGFDVVSAAVKTLNGVELVRTRGTLTSDELLSEIHCADVVVACGLCEPWGMRVNDVLLEGVPVILSDGMGAAMLCDEYGCGCVVPKGDPDALAAVLRRCMIDHYFLKHLKSGAQKASRAILPEVKAKEWLDVVVDK